jgi:hypothetical protein
MAIEQAHRIIGWQENMMSDEMPPRWMWHLDHELELWFERVETEREAKYGGDGSGDESTPMMSNDLAQGRK